ncbi:hypothetical protein LPJ66_000744 [Kickxella alabastrina]|uniref:Uncharacterized protein n=1 Tax=Kickxella alabastrina TaxID=61397 RepID=A0ACC1IVG1_9FUNG|nr:hypothetical protein LPJ66_000744 [Kickxella alabastrina]
MSWGNDGMPPRSSDEREAFERQWKEYFRNLSFSQNSTYAQLPPKVRSAADKLVGDSGVRAHATQLDGARNGSSFAGVYHGNWQAEHFEGAQLSAGFSRPGDGAVGRMTLELVPASAADRELSAAEPAVSPQLVHGTITMLAPGFSGRLQLRGVHWQDAGTAVLYGVSEMHALAPIGAVRAMPSASAFAQAKQAFGTLLLGGLRDYEMPEDVIRACEYQVFVRLGLGLGTDGQSARTILFSSDCGVSVTTEGSLAGVSAERYRQRTTIYLRMLLAALAGLLALLVRQIQFSETHAALAKVSFYTVAGQAMLELLIFVAHFSDGLTPSGDMRPDFSGLGFVVFVLLMLATMHYLTVLWSTQDLRQQEEEPTRRVWLPYVRLYAVLLAGAFVIHLYTETLNPVAAPLLAVLLTAAYSFWLPQIIRNAVRGTARGLRIEYVVGSTAIHLLFPLYVFAYPDNIAFIAPVSLVWALAGYVVAQAIVLLLQDLLGPRFFVPAKLLPEVYNYHPLLPPDDEESALETSDLVVPDVTHDGTEPFESSSSAGNSSDPSSNAQDDAVVPVAPAASGRRTSPRECAICIESVDVTTATDRTQYMVTPCHHVYHTDCLVPWMNTKLECPVCRAPLPPV